MATVNNKREPPHTISVFGRQHSEDVQYLLEQRCSSLGIFGLKALDSLKKLQSDTATVLRGGRWGQIDAVNVVAWFQKVFNRLRNQSQISFSLMSLHDSA